MGYLTHYTLMINDSLIQGARDFRINEIPNLDKVLLEEIPTYDGMPFDEFITWYNHDADMLRVSLQFPNLIFRLHGDGEKAGDIWETVYVNGTKFECETEIIFKSPSDKDILAVMGEPKKTD